MKRQYIIQKYVMAENATEALKKARKAPIHEVFIHNDWFQRNADSKIYTEDKKKSMIGFKKK